MFCIVIPGLDDDDIDYFVFCSLLQLSGNFFLEHIAARSLLH